MAEFSSNLPEDVSAFLTCDWHDEHHPQSEQFPPDHSQVMGLDGYTSEVGTTWNIFTVVLLCPTIFKAEKIACHNKLELETSTKYCSCFFWMIASLYMVYKKMFQVPGR